MAAVLIAGSNDGRLIYDNDGPVAMPVSLTQIIDKDSFVMKVEITNNSGTTRTVSIQDGNGVYLVPPHALANTEILTYTADSPGGRRMTGGVWWQADGSGCVGYVTGFLQ